MGRKLEAEFPEIVWTPCATHSLDLLMEDIGKLNWVKSVVDDALSIVTFVNNKVKVLAIYRMYSTLELKKPSKTRFATMWIFLERLYEVQEKLQMIVISNKFKGWMEGETRAVSDQAKAIQRLCLRESFWKDMKGIVVVVTPLYKVLRMTDKEGATLGLLYHFMKIAIEEIKACTILDGPVDPTW